METILSLVRLCERLLRDGWNIDWMKLRFSRGEEALVVLFALAAAAAVAFFVGRRSRKVPGRAGVVLPALPPSLAPGPGRWERRLPAVLVLAGLVFFLIALADPYITFIKQEVTNPGRRILILLDASGSMGGGSYENRFKKTMTALKVRYVEPFYTATAAAEYFVRARMKSGYQDLIGLIEFGDESYVISPFNTDYENVLTSIRLLSDPEEYRRFDNSGTKIAQAINQGVNLFKTFAFLKSSGNIMVLISDGEDMQVEHEGRKLDDILAESSKNKVPIFFIRMASDKPLGHPATNDQLWGAAVEKTGGKLYAGANADVIVQACDEINKIAAGRIQYTRYSARTSQYPFFALAAVLCWSLALALWLVFRLFRKFP
ncbi:MAG: VWA domain-containing protein [Deltaproteobacteria bacterium]|nr:VWA domain-containing protein [Deltaproteobacteria bacterium]